MPNANAVDVTNSKHWTDGQTDMLDSMVTRNRIHNVSALTIGNTLTDTWKGVFQPFHHFIYAHVCLFTLAPIKISKSNQNLSL